MSRGVPARTLAVLAVSLAVAAPAEAQSPAACAPESVASNAAAAADARPPITFKRLAPDIVRDQKAIWLAPFRAARGRHWKPFAGATLATIALVALDPYDTPYFRRTAAFGGFNRVVSGRNAAIGIAAVPAITLAAGLARQDHGREQTALLAAEALADSEFVGVVMKDADRRLRPSDIAPGGDFTHTWFKSHGTLLNGENAAFPSGHTLGAFSVATVFAERYRQRRWVPWAAYGLAGLVGFSRLTLTAHFPSDVLVGAVLGTLIARDVAHARQ